MYFSAVLQQDRAWGFRGLGDYSELEAKGRA